MEDTALAEAFKKAKETFEATQRYDQERHIWTSRGGYWFGHQDANGSQEESKG